MALAFGPPWRLILDVSRGTVVFLHPAGLHFDLSEEALVVIDEDESDAIQEAVQSAVGTMHGLIDVTIHRSEEHGYSATVMEAPR